MWDKTLFFYQTSSSCTTPAWWGNSR